jgi:CRP-like cAMP-binding protein
MSKVCRRPAHLLRKGQKCQGFTVPVRFKEPANYILAGLGHEEYERVARHLRPLLLRKGQTICDIGDVHNYVYFVSSGILSLLLSTESGETFEVAMVGREGVVGVAAVIGLERMPYSIVVSSQGEFLQASAAAIKAEFPPGGQLQSLVLAYTHSLLVQVAQLAVCNRFHSLEHRLARWLLLTRDAVGSTTLHVTHEFISRMLGTQRSLVTAAAGMLQEAGLIRYHYRRITILNPDGLEADACECYRVLSREIKRTLTPQDSLTAQPPNRAA